MDFYKLKIKYWKFKNNLSFNQKIVFLFLFFVILGGFIFLFFSSFSFTEGKNKNLKKEENSKIVVEKTKEIKPGGKKVYMDFKKNEIVFYKDGRPVQKYNLEENVEIEECFNFSKNISDKVYNFGGDDFEIFFSGLKEERLNKLKEESNLYCINGLFENPPVLSADSYFSAILKNDKKLISKNSKGIYSIASISKLITSIILLEDLDLEKITKVSRSAYMVPTNGAGDLKIGDKIKVGDLIFPLLIESSNVGAEVIAEFYGREKFLNLMNVKADDLGLESSNFNCPSGVSPENVSSTEDLYELIKYIYNNQKYILNVSKLKNYFNGEYNWVNNNKFVGKRGFLGGKIGYIPEASYTGVFVFNTEVRGLSEQNVAISVLKSLNRERDVKKILDYIKEDIFLAEAKKVESEKDFLKDEIKIIFAGDIMMDRGVLNSVNKNGNGDFNFLFENLEYLKDADIVFGNLEGPVSDKGRDSKKAYSFRMKPEALDTLSDFGFDALSVSNNHAGDWGVNAFEDTLKRLKEKNILAVGGIENEELKEYVKIIEQDGFKIGFLGFSDVGPNWLEAKKGNSGIFIYKNKNQMEEIIKNAESEADFLVASFHFGEEYQPLPNERQKNIARSAVDAGADIVIGHHPHVAQPVERYKEGVIAYSLGNFIFDQNFSKETMEGLLLEIYFGQDGLGEVKKIKTMQNEKFQPKLK